MFFNVFTLRTSFTYGNIKSVCILWLSMCRPNQLYIIFNKTSKKKTFLIKIIIKINLVNLKLVLSLVSRAFSLLLSLYSASISAHPHNHLHVHTANIGAKETLICLLLGIISTISTSRFPTLHTGTTHAKSFGRFSWLQFWAKHTWGYSVSCWVMFSPAGHPDVSFYLYGCC